RVGAADRDGGVAAEEQFLAQAAERAAGGRDRSGEDRVDERQRAALADEGGAAGAEAVAVGGAEAAAAGDGVAAGNVDGPAAAAAEAAVAGEDRAGGVAAGAAA